MPGFSLQRFVDLSESERTELQCIICREILKNPVFVKCCLQTYCEECINQWLINNNTCPYDRQPLQTDQLTRPPRLLMNMLGKLKIGCTFKHKGCKEVMFLDDLTNHLKSCPFDKKMCKKCNFESLEGHDCIQNLLQLNEKLESDLRNTSIRINSLEKQNEYYLQKIQNICDNSDDNNISKFSENQLLIDARKHFNSLTLISRSTPQEMTDKIVSIVKNAINEGINLYEICVQIRKCVELEFGGLWVCHTIYDSLATISCTIDNNCFVCLKIAKLKISVHKVYEEIDFTKISRRLLNTDLSEEFSIYRTDMKANSIEIIKQILINCFDKYDNWTDFMESIFNELAKELGGVWNVIVYKQFLGHFCVIPKTKQFINLCISGIDFAIFQILN